MDRFTFSGKAGDRIRLRMVNTTAGSLSASGEFDCFTFTGSLGDQINVHAVETSGTLTAVQEIVRPNGTTICGPTTATDHGCTLDSAGPYTILVEDSTGTNSGGYTVAVTKLN